MCLHGVGQGRLVYYFLGVRSICINGKGKNITSESHGTYVRDEKWKIRKWCLSMERKRGWMDGQNQELNRVKHDLLPGIIKIYICVGSIVPDDLQPTLYSPPQYLQAQTLSKITEQQALTMILLSIGPRWLMPRMYCSHIGLLYYP